MKRWEFTIGLSLATMLISERAKAQGLVKRRIAIVGAALPARLLTEAEGGATWQAFFDELRRDGYVERENLVVERYSAEGHPERWADLAREVADGKPDLMITTTGRMAKALDLPNNVTPIIAFMADPIRFGFVKSLAQPGGNITGVSIDAGLEILGKRLQILKETIPSVSNVAFLVTRSGWDGVAGQELREGSHRLGIILTGAVIEQSTDLEYQRALDDVAKQRPDAIFISDAAEHFPYRRLIVEAAAKQHAPTMCPTRDFVQVGGLMAYATDGRRMAGIAGRILEGAKPRDIPIYQATKFELVINLKTAKSLGLMIPQSLLVRANEVIE